MVCFSYCMVWFWGGSWCSSCKSAHPAILLGCSLVGVLEQQWHDFPLPGWLDSRWREPSVIGGSEAQTPNISEIACKTIFIFIPGASGLAIFYHGRDAIWEKPISRLQLDLINCNALGQARLHAWYSVFSCFIKHYNIHPSGQKSCIICSTE